MKKIIFLGILLLLSDIAFSQIIKPRHKKGESRIERLEKIKLIEALDLDEETTLKFFSRRAEHRKVMQAFQQNADDKMFEIEKALRDQNISDSDSKKLLNEYFNIEKNIINERISFFTSLNDILSIQQINKILIFERKFKQELRDVIINERQRRKN